MWEFERKVMALAKQVISLMENVEEETMQEQITRMMAQHAIAANKVLEEAQE